MPLFDNITGFTFDADFWSENPEGLDDDGGLDDIGLEDEEDDDKEDEEEDDVQEVANAALRLVTDPFPQAGRNPAEEAEELSTVEEF